jgi:hypothetical protein
MFKYGALVCIMNLAAYAAQNSLDDKRLWLYAQQEYPYDQHEYMLEDGIRIKKVCYSSEKKITIVYPRIAGLSSNKVQKIINQSIKQLFIESSNGLYAQKHPHEFIRYIADCEVQKIKSALIIRRIDYSRMKMGAYGSADIRVFHFDLNTGGLITLMDICKHDAKCIQKITDLAREKVRKEFDCDKNDLLLDDFILCNDGIEFFFQPYEIACGAAGFPVIKILNSEINTNGLCLINT